MCSRYLIVLLTVDFVINVRKIIIKYLEDLELSLDLCKELSSFKGHSKRFNWKITKVPPTL